MMNEMGMQEATARFVYTAARCGIVHQAMTTHNLWLSYGEEDHWSNVYVVDVHGKIVLLVRSLAQGYTHAVSRLHKHDRNKIKHLPNQATKLIALGTDVVKLAADAARECEANIGSHSAEELDRLLKNAVQLNV
jgi:hypothetical protein